MTRPSNVLIRVSAERTVRRTRGQPRVQRTSTRAPTGAPRTSRKRNFAPPGASSYLYGTAAWIRGRAAVGGARAPRAAVDGIGHAVVVAVWHETEVQLQTAEGVIRPAGLH